MTALIASMVIVLAAHGVGFIADELGGNQGRWTGFAYAVAVGALCYAAFPH